MRIWINSVVAAGIALTGALISLTVAPTGAVNAASSPPSIITSNFVCNNGVCSVGPGNTAMPFAAGLLGTGGPAYSGPECNSFIMKVSAGSLPPGLQLGEPICEWEISGTPTAAGIYHFTVQIAPQPNNLGQTVGPDGYQQFSITIGTGASDRVFLSSAVWSLRTVTLQVRGFDVNNNATYTIYVTSTGAKLGTVTEQPPYNGGDGTILFHLQTTRVPSSLTVTSSVGGSATIAVARNNGY